MPPRSAKPQGQITRGKTARNRLRPTDNFLLMYDPGLLTRADGEFSRALWVDLGYGAEPFTTLESASRYRKIAPTLGVLGVEIAPERLERARPYADEHTFFRLGGFNLPLLPGESVRAIRAFNVLRQYEEAQVFPAWRQMAQGVLPGGLLLEGTSNPFGSILAMNVLRRQAQDAQPWRLEALALYTNFRLGFDPVEFQTILPKNLIHRVVAGEPIQRFFEDWKSACAETAQYKTFGLRSWFAASQQALARRGCRLLLQKRWINHGWLVWQNPPLVQETG